ncbi:MAG: hypothetical protein HOK90_24450 [Gemmatimonadetes bacterium]|nr:hypothetical protein [Gemmatimonadota bacterium]
MIRLLAMVLCAALIYSDSHAEIKRWRVGDEAHPWTLLPVTGRLDLGRSWAVELIADDDGDGLIDEDPVELIDNDNDGSMNEDPVDPQIDNDGDGLINEDPDNNLDDDGDGLIDEDPPELIDNDIDGQVNEDGPDPQFDNDGDGLLNEDGLYSVYDDDWDGLLNEDEINGLDDDGDGLIDEDPSLPDHGDGVTTWLRPVRLDSSRNLTYMLNQRFKAGEYGGLVPGKAVQRPFMVVPSEYGFRREVGDPISADYWAAAGVTVRKDSEKAVDGNLNTAFTSTKYGRGGLGVNLMGFYYLNRIVFRPRPTLPGGTIANYYIQFGDQSSIDIRNESIQPRRSLVAATRGQFNPVIKDLRFDQPFIAGRVDLISIDPEGKLSQAAEIGYFGDGYAIDGQYTSAIIDVGTSTPRSRRYDRGIEQFSASARDAFLTQFDPDVAGATVNWGKVRWRGRSDGREGDVRIQFRVGNTLDTHIYARLLGPGLTSTDDEDGNDLDLFSWIKIAEGRVPERELLYNELGVDLGNDGRLGWSFWSAPFNLADGLIDESLPESEWHKSGVQLPLPGGTRYIQFRVFFDSEQHSAALLDFIEFDYDSPLVSGGVVAEIFPPRVPLGEEISFHYYMRPLFGLGETSAFNRIEIAVPSTDTRIDTLRFDGQDWTEIAGTGNGDDPLLDTNPERLAPNADNADSLGQFAQTVVLDPVTNSPKLLIKVPRMSSEHFQFGQNIEVIFKSKLFRGSKEFTSLVWNDAVGDPRSTIPQPVSNGDATPEVATNAWLVVVDDIANVVNPPIITPNPFTPNGDGINDEITFTFDLFLLLEEVEVELAIYDLSGRRLAQLQKGGSSAGKLEVKWGGRNDEGEMVPPGLYLYRLLVDSDNTSTERSGTLSLVY